MNDSETSSAVDFDTLEVGETMLTREAKLVKDSAVKDSGVVVRFVMDEMLLGDAMATEGSCIEDFGLAPMLEGINILLPVGENATVDSIAADSSAVEIMMLDRIVLVGNAILMKDEY